MQRGEKLADSRKHKGEMEGEIKKHWVFGLKIEMVCRAEQISWLKNIVD